MKRHLTCAALICMCFLLHPFSVFSAGMTGQKDHKVQSNLPITIKSNEMIADNKGKTATFSGKVVAKQGDVTIFSDKLVVGYADAGGEVDKVEAFGNVRIVQLNRTGFSDHAIYESSTGRVVLTGTPRVLQGGDSVSGKVITYFVDDDKSFVTNGGDPKVRVEAVINTPARKNDAGSH